MVALSAPSRSVVDAAALRNGVCRCDRSGGHYSDDVNGNYPELAELNNGLNLGEI